MAHIRAFLIVLILSFLVPGLELRAEYSVLPISLIATSSQSPRIEIDNWLQEGLVYDATFTNPDQHENGLPVDCWSANWIGVVFLVQRPRARPIKYKAGYIRHVWTHSELQVRHRRLNHTHNMLFRDTETVTIDWELLELDAKLKEDGIWTLRSYVGKDLVAEEMFSLKDCGRDVQIIDVSKEPEPSDTKRAAVVDIPVKEPVEIVCRKEKATGSHRKTTVCRARTELDRRREKDQELIRDVQTVPGTNRPP